MPDQDTATPNDLTEFMSTAGTHEGFHRIAYAIRQCTVIPQRRNANAKTDKTRAKSLYDIRYGLGNNLRRKTDSARDFMEALTEFVHIYNAETEQVFENTSEERAQDPTNYARLHYRQRVNEEDLDDVLQLVARYGPQLVCNMLVAYGYATPRRKGPDGGNTDDRSHDGDASDQPAQ